MVWNASAGDRYQLPVGFGPIGWIPDRSFDAMGFVPPTPYDRHVRRSGDDYALAYTQLFPHGQAWPTWSADSNLMNYIAGAAQIWGDVDARAADLLERESDPRRTMDLLSDWERAFGLPDDCLAEPLTVADRQLALVARLTLYGGQSRQFYYDYAAAIGQQIRIIEHSPFECGLSECGDTRAYTDSGWWRWEIGDPINRFVWTIAPAIPRLTWFRCGGTNELGKDHFLEIGLFTDAECIWNRLKPAHTILGFDFNSLVPITKYQGL